MFKCMLLSNLIWSHKFTVEVYMTDFQIFINNHSQYHIFLDAHIGVDVLGY